MKNRQVNLAYLLILLFGFNSNIHSKNSTQKKGTKSQKPVLTQEEKDKEDDEKRLALIQRLKKEGKLPATHEGPAIRRQKNKENKINAILEFKMPLSFLSEIIGFIPEINQTIQKIDVNGWQENDNGFFNINILEKNYSGYAFITDPWNNVQTFFDPSTKTGIAGLSVSDQAYQTLSNIFKLAKNSNTSSSVTLLFLGFDKNGKYINDIIKTPPTTFGLYAYDQQGKLLKNFPISVNPTDAIDLSKFKPQTNTSKTATGGFGIFKGQIIDAPQMKYPFAIKISVKLPVFATQPISNQSITNFAGAYAFFNTSYNIWREGIVHGSHISVNPYTQAWLSVSFNPGQSDHHLLMNLENKHGLTNKTEEYMWPSMKLFHHVDRPTLDAGIIFSFIEYNNKSYVCAQAASKISPEANAQGDSLSKHNPFKLNENSFLGWAPLINAPYPLPNTYVITGADIFTKITENKNTSFLVTTSCTPKNGVCYSFNKDYYVEDNIYYYMPTMTELPQTVNIPHPLIWPGFNMYDVLFYREIDYSSQPLTLFFLWMLDSKTGKKVGVGNIPIAALNEQLKKSNVVLKFVYNDTNNTLAVTGYNADTEVSIPSLSFVTPTTPLSAGQVPEGYIRYSYQAGANPLEYHIPKNRDLTLEELKGGVSILIKNK